MKISKKKYYVVGKLKILESFNTNKILKCKDRKRVDEIKKCLQCRFVGYNPVGIKIIDEIPNGSIKESDK